MSIIGIDGGTLPVGFGVRPFEVSVTAPHRGSRGELREVLDPARAGAVEVHVETSAMGEAPLAYQRLHDGRISGHARILPNG
ncbi:hypothetical protein [Nocardia sp. CY41]|uniref:hypothetical protein n=1 Tax=Nocardia sp. CY41 TaxID=2608686 RepID=UPI001915A4A5|nr:hypothetical protein [Nocardia sp. CY41]